jgi:hypothetical protein
MNNREYQLNEIERCNRELADSKRGFFDTVAEFADHMASADKGWISEQIDWIANGSYGAGQCFELQRRIAACGPRSNVAACVGKFVLACLYGNEKRDLWNKLDSKTQAKFDGCVKAWLVGKKEFGQTLEA